MEGELIQISDQRYLVFPETYVINQLLTDSDAFRNYYALERHKIPEPLYWAKAKLPLGITGSSDRIWDGSKLTRVVVLNEVPAKLAHVKVTAHELGHFILDIEGFPSLVSVNRNLIEFVTKIQSAIQDPIIDRRLQNSGISLKEDYKSEIRKSHKTLKLLTPPNHFIGQLEWAFNYVGLILQARIIEPPLTANMRDFQQFFRHRFPLIESMAQEIIKIVDEVGFETPATMENLLGRIVDKYSLQRELALAYSK